MSCIIMGHVMHYHSFIRRMRAQYAPPGCRGFSDDVTELAAALELATHLKLSDVFVRGVYTYSSVSKITDIPVSWKPKCDMLIIDLGSNDIAQLKRDNKFTIEQLADFLFDWASRADVKCVLILGVLPRSRGLRGSASHFNFNRNHYHEALEQLCGGSRRMNFGKIRGFEGIDQSMQHGLNINTWRKL